MTGTSDFGRRARSWQARLIAFGVVVVLLALLPLMVLAAGFVSAVAG